MNLQLGPVLVLLILSVSVVGAVSYAQIFGCAAHHFDNWFPTTYQRDLCRRLSRTQEGFLALVRAVDEAKALKMDDAYVQRLEAAKENARTLLHFAEAEVLTERASLAKPKKFDRLLEEWGDRD